jgi:hypothetical protein
LDLVFTHAVTVSPPDTAIEFEYGTNTSSLLPSKFRQFPNLHEEFVTHVVPLLNAPVFLFELESLTFNPDPSLKFQ